mgnify:CR=1 FL=1
MTKIKAGLIQMSLKGSVEHDSKELIRKKMIESHSKLIEDAANQGVQVLGMQEFFNAPYFPASQDLSWYSTAERIPDGPTIMAIRDLAKQFEMVIVAPIYEETMPGVYYNTAAVIDADGSYLGSFRKVHIPQIVGYNEKLFFKPGDLGYPVFETAYCKLGVYICYDRHFPEGWRELALNGAELVINPSATTTGLSDHIWKLEQPAAAVANGIFVGTINRVGLEAPWNVGTFYGTSYFTNPRGEIMSEAPSDKDALITTDIDLNQIRKAREGWQFYRDRRPETYTKISKL